MLPELLYRRLEEIGLDFALLYPTSGLSVLSNPDDELRQAAARRSTPTTPSVRRLPRPARAGRRHPHVHPRRGGRRARPRRRHARAQGRGHERRRAPERPTRRLARVVGRHARPRQPPRLRPALGAVRRARRRARLPRDRLRLGQPGVADELRLQPPGQLRRRPGGGVPLAGHGRGAHAPPGAALRVPRGRRRLGGPALRRPARPLREAQRATRCRCSTRRASTSRRPASCSPSSPTARSAATGIASTRAPGPWATPSVARYGIDDFAESGITGPEDIVDIFTRQLGFGCEADDPLNALAFDAACSPTAPG